MIDLLVSDARVRLRVHAPCLQPTIDEYPIIASLGVASIARRSLIVTKRNDPDVLHQIVIAPG